MSIEIGLLLLESVLLVATIILLVLSLKEGRQRDKLLGEMSKATRILTRQEYFLTVLDAMMSAKEEIVGCITGRFPGKSDSQMTKDISAILETLTKKGVRVKYLLPKFPDRLHVGSLYTKAGAEIMYSSCLMVHNMRFIIVDDRMAVIGIPESIGEAEATGKGYRIPSEGLSMVLKSYFNTCEKQTSFGDYVKEVMKQTGATAQHLAREYKIDEDELKKFLET
ncbi:MAG: hypothetical protein C4538_05830 [Nitrospiraceae bacterium]|nr:MAG: hypothetical protein C4538_05830 [Nitrospiraceae bacterium]